MLTFATLFLTAIISCSSATVEDSANGQKVESATVGQVSLQINFGDKNRPNLSFEGLDIVQGMTVAELMQFVVESEKVAAIQQDAPTHGDAPTQGDAPTREDAPRQETAETQQVTGNPAKFSFDSSGNGKLTFLKSIQGVASEGAGKQNWMYYVNDAKADRGFGAFQLKPGDRIVWKLEKYDESAE